jgi:hypothetical protein
MNECGAGDNTIKIEYNSFEKVFWGHREDVLNKLQNFNCHSMVEE